MLFLTALFLSLYGATAFLGELLYKKGIGSEYTRKGIHIISSLITFLLPMYLDKPYVIALLVTLTLLNIFSHYTHFFKGIEESGRKGIGSILYPTGVLISAVIFLPERTQEFQAGVLVLGFSDGLAAIIGKKFGRRKLKIFTPKTLEGSMTFFITTFIISTSFLVLNANQYNSIASYLSLIIFIILASINLTIIEALFSRGMDNLIIPTLGSLSVMVIIA